LSHINKTGSPRDIKLAIKRIETSVKAFIPKEEEVNAKVFQGIGAFY